MCCCVCFSHAIGLIGMKDILAVTEGYPQLLTDSASSFRGSLPVVANLPPIREIFESQERVTVDMAHQLESLAKHFEQMEATLHDHEAGAHFSEDDLAGESFAHVNIYAY